MDTNTLFLILLVLMLVFCVGPMLFMRKRHDHSEHEHKGGEDHSKVGSK